MDKLNFDIKLESGVGSNIADVFCVHCQDRQFVHPVRDGVPDYSSTIPCPDCYNERARLQGEHTALGLSGIPLPRMSNNFSTFKPNKANQEALSACTELSTGRANFKLLLLYGGFGCGKTHLAYASCHKAIECGTPARYYSVPNLLTEMKRLMKDSNTDSIINQVCAVEFLALDDWGANKDTGWTDSVIEQIIDYRYAHKKALIVTTNRDLKALPPSVVSRFKDTESRMVLNEDIDRRGK